MSRVHIMQAIDDSLKRLQMDYVDIYYIHHVDSQTPLEEMLPRLRRSRSAREGALYSV